MNLNSSLLLVLITAVLSLSACSESAPTGERAVVAAQGKPVEAARFDALALFLQRDASASVVSANTSRLSVEVGGRIASIPVRVGQRVQRGDLLVSIADADYRLALDRAAAMLVQAKSRLELSQAQLARAQELSARSFVSPEVVQTRTSERDIAEADHRAAQVQLASAQRELEKTSLRAPFSGVVSVRGGQLGEVVAPGTVLLTLVADRGIEVRANVQAADVADLIAGVEAAFVMSEVMDLNDAADVKDGSGWPLKVLRVSPVLDTETRLAEVRFVFVDKHPPIGSAGRVIWRDARPSLPPSLFARRNGVYGIFVVEAGKARFHHIPGVQEGRPVRVVLPPDTLIVRTGQARLQDGDAVEVKQRESARDPVSGSNQHPAAAT